MYFVRSPVITELRGQKKIYLTVIFKHGKPNEFDKVNDSEIRFDIYGQRIIRV